MLRAITALSVAIVCLLGLTAAYTGDARPTENAPKKWKPKAPGSDMMVYVPECKSAEKAIVYYRAKVWKYQKELGETPLSTYYPERKKNACAYKRFVVGNWRGLAKEYRKEVAHYRYHWNWEAWLPDKWQRIGACETGYGTRPGRWDWNSGTYQGAFGFYHGTWDQYKVPGAPSEAYLATPRQQYQTALRVAAVHGYGAWGCGGA